MAPARAQRSKAALTGKNRGKEEERLEGALDLIGERRAAVSGALDTPWQHGHVAARGATCGRA